jgi:hypothetical protein
MIIHNPILTGSFTVNGTDVASITSSAASITALNSYTASQNILNGTYATTGSNTFKNPQTINSNLIVTGSITAQTLVVQTVSSSVIYSSGSNVFGNNIANTQVFTGSMSLTGSLTVVTTGTEFQVTSTGVRIGNVSTDTHPITGSVNVSGSATFSGSLTSNGTFTAGASNGNIRLKGSTDGFLGVGESNGLLYLADWNTTAKGLQINLSTGAATFSSSVRSTSFIATPGGTFRLNTDVDAILGYMLRSGAWKGSAENNLAFATDGAYGIGFFTNGSTTERMFITTGGDVLIGTTSTASAYSKVTIRGTNQGLAIQDAATNNYRAIYSQSGALYFYNGSNEGYLSSGGTWVNASDITLKKDVKEIEYGMAEVMKLKPKWYRMIEDNLEQIGFIAQDVEEILPELVSTSERGMKGLSYGQLTAVLVKAIQELQAQITELKNK